jgi:hypothetical protein
VKVESTLFYFTSELGLYRLENERSVQKDVRKGLPSLEDIGNVGFGQSKEFVQELAKKRKRKEG